MKSVKMAFCFLDENDIIVAKKDLNVSWNLKPEKDRDMIRDTIVMDEVCKIIDHQVKLEIDDGVIRELLDVVKGKCDE